jgi:coatomer protein complex subunit gamma
LAHLCEFIEDCEHTSLAVRILHLLGSEGPKTSNPARYIRYIYNRVILENATVRAAAVSALARFGALCDDLLPNILVLLSRCQMDSDDEVRDRATYFKAILEQQQQQLNSQFILNSLQVSLSSLEKALHGYTLSTCEKPFDMKSVPAAPVEVAKKQTPEGSLGGVKKADSKPTATRHDVFVEKLSAIPEIAECGALFKSSQPAELTGEFTNKSLSRILKGALKSGFLPAISRSTGR